MTRFLPILALLAAASAGSSAAITMPRPAVAVVPAPRDSADTLWKRAREKDPTLNKVTVYRTLGLLKKHGLVDELDLLHLQGGRHYYEARTTRDHIHLACLKCGRIQEFESSLFEKLKGQIERERRFRISVVRVEAGGYCDKCRE